MTTRYYYTQGKKSKESLKTSIPELRSRCSLLGYFVLFCSSGKELMSIHSLSCLYYIISNIYYIYSMRIYNIYICVHISFTSIWNHVVSCNTLTRNQTYSLDHSWCNFSIKSFIIQQLGIAQHQSSLTRILSSLFFQSSSHLLPLSPFFSHLLHIVPPLDVQC